MHARRINLRRHRHGRRREILHLLQAKPQILRLQRQLRHVLGPRTRMRRDEIRNDLRLLFSRLLRRPIELLLERVEQLERRLPHHLQHVIARVLRRHFQPPRHVMRREFLDVFLVTRLHLRRRALVVQKQVVANPARHKRVLHARRFAHRLVNVQQRCVICIQIPTYIRPDAARAHALVADPLLLALHLIHVRRRTAEIRDRPAKIRHLLHLLHLAQNRRLAPARHKLPLVRRNRAEAAPAKTPAVHVDRVLDHLIRRNRPALPIFRVRQPRVGQVETLVDLLLAHRRIRRIHHQRPLAYFLHEPARLHAVRLRLDTLEVLRIPRAVRQAFLVRMQREVVPIPVLRQSLARLQHHRRLRNRFQR